MTRALVFPGQGSQSVGMGKSLYDGFASARAVFDEVDDALGEKLSTVIFDGPEDQLTLTHNTQPALMAVSMAAMRAMEEKGFDLKTHATHVAGHSLGEYSALAASGAFSITTAAKLLRVRGNAMQKAVPVGAGAMAALLGLDWDGAVEVCTKASTETEVCSPANDNAPGQVVVSGAKAAVERAAEIAKEMGAKRAIMLPVSAPFHCAMMSDAADVMAGALAEAHIKSPIVPVIANITAEPVSDPDDIRDLLVRQVTGTVRWRESVLTMKSLGINQLVEVGAGKVLSGLVRRIDKDITGVCVNTPEDIDAFVESL
ncbi:MAG: ACP S-malonyltransferase [Rhodospirillaceae bacterium]|nr:ACP S-malonyltransferase [Rhodospirillaceae bacterium]